MSITFEWDQNKSEANEEKHGITFEEAKTVFNDPDHSDDEYRYIDIGFSSKGSILVLWYTERNENIRIIGCRKASKFERKTYEKKYT